MPKKKSELDSWDQTIMMTRAKVILEEFSLYMRDARVVSAVKAEIKKEQQNIERLNQEINESKDRIRQIELSVRQQKWGHLTGIVSEEDIESLYSVSPNNLDID